MPPSYPNSAPLLPLPPLAAPGRRCHRRAPPYAPPSLQQQGLSAPTLQSSLNYLLLGVVYTTLHVRACGWRWRCPWWAYALLALIDVEANFCLVLAYRYTSMTR